MADVLRDEQGEEVAMAQAFGLSAGLEFGIESPHGRQMQTPEHAVEIERRLQPGPCGRRWST
jgi:hypothetical protein